MSGFIRRSLILAAAAFPMGLSLGAGPAPVHVPAAIVADKDAAPPAKDAAPQPATQPAKEAAPVPATGYSIKQIGDALRNMGYEPKEVQNNQGGYLYTLVFTRGTWTFSLNISLCSDNSYIWLSAPLTQISDPAQASPQALLKLLEQNFNIGPAYFTYRPTMSQYVYLTKPIPNHGMTPAVFRTELEEFLTTIQDTYPMWDKKALIVANPTTTPSQQPTVDAR